MSNAAVAAPEPLSDVLTAPHPVPRLRRRVLVTGASGMLGCDVAPVLAGAGFEVFARPKSDLDITRPVEVSAAFHDVRPQVVVNCAAFTRVDDAETDPRAFDVNARGVRLLAEHCLRHSAQLVQISTDFIFDGCKEFPYVEEDGANPLPIRGAAELIDLPRSAPAKQRQRTRRFPAKLPGFSATQQSPFATPDGSRPRASPSPPPPAWRQLPGAARPLSPWSSTPSPPPTSPLA